MDISRLFERFMDAIYSNTIKGTVETNVELKVNAILNLKEWQSKRIVFEYKGNKVILTTTKQYTPHEVVNYPAVKNIYMVSSYDKNTNNITIQYIIRKIFSHFYKSIYYLNIYFHSNITF